MSDAIEPTGFEIAIVGLAGRFPDAADLEQFWRNLRQGRESITVFSDEEARAAGVDPERLRDPGYVKAGAVLSDADRFDAGFFGYSPREAAVLDPQQRVFLECAWEALEDAGYNPETYPGAIGVFGGASLNTYLLFNLAHNPDVRAAVDGYQLTLGNDKDFLTTRVSYKLNLRGPSVNVQTACSTSLVAVHLACQSLIGYQCDLALAGGVSIRFPQKQGYRYTEGGILSPDGHCRAFDERAAGTVSGEGAGIVVLKRLADALADGDAIRAVIKGTAINNDGANKVGYTAPSVDGQAEVIAGALSLAGVDAATIQHIEAHGTGTALGDPIEIAALQQVFGPSVPGRDVISISSLKTNLGHLDAAAGVAGLIKTVLSLQHRELPANLHFTRPNPRLNLEKTPFFINSALRPWPAPADGGPRRAGVSSFGIGGTNVHAVLEEAPEPGPSGPSRPWQLLTVSARSPEALDAATARLAARLQAQPDLNLADAAYTLHLGRKAFAERRIVIARDRAEAVAALEALPAALTYTAPRPAGTARLAFLFTGQGAQYPGMARGLYEAEPVFREHLDRCAALLRPHLDAPLLEVVFGEGQQTKDEREDAWPPASRPGRLDQTAFTQPALFAVEYALAQLWMRWGVKPTAMLGHSIGEYVAACLAGVFSLEAALALVAARGRLMQSLPPGAMLSVPLPESEVRRHLNGHVSVAAVNAPALCVVSGPADAVAAVDADLRRAGVEARRLRTSHAFHSAMMDPILDAFAERVAAVELRAPQLPFISNVTGTWITDDQATDPQYWARHLRQAVRFADGVAELLKEPDRAFLEVGPGRTLATLVKSQPGGAERALVTSLRHPNEAQADQAHLLLALGRLWAAGVQPDWAAFHAGETRRRVPLPTYPFERERYWVEPPTGLAAPRPAEIRKRPAVREWAYVPSWRRQDHPELAGRALSAALEARKRWLILANVDDLSAALVRQLHAAGHEVVTASTGSRFDQLAERQYTLDPGRAEDFDSLLDELRLLERLPEHVVLDLRRGFGDDAGLRGFYSLLYLARALGRQVAAPVQVLVLTTNAHPVTGDERLAPARAAAVGLSRVIPQEYPHLTCRCVDVGAPVQAARLLAEFFAPPAESLVAYRGAHRWVQAFEPLDLAHRDGPPLRPGGVYLITGGLGRIGLTLAEHLARTARAKLALVGRGARLEAERLAALEALGAEVLVIGADVADEAQLRAAVAQAEGRFGPLNGVLHAAGAVGQAAVRALAETGPAEAEAQFRAKVHGLTTLACVLDGKPLDFVMLFSSLSAVLGGLGLGAYAAANAFMDAFASAQSRRAPETAFQRWVSVNWDGWDFGETTSRHARSVGELSMTPAEGVQVFEQVLALDGPAQVVISTADLEARRAKWQRPAPAPAEASQKKAALGGRHARPRTGTAFVAPRDDVERAVAEMWGEVLGLEPIGADDDFFELGGHSLLATQLAARVRDAFQVDLPLRRLFEAPTVAGIAALLRSARPATAPPSAITPLPRDGRVPLPLSFGQQRLWFLDQLEPGSPLYNNPAAVRLTGPLDVDALERALGEIIRRHEILRTTYQAEDGQPRPVIAASLETRRVMSRQDLSSLPAGEREAEVRRLAIAEAQQPFDLARGPLLRVALLKLAEAEHVVLLTMHHIVSDGWSLGVFTRELAALYDAFARGAPSSLPPLPIQYADFAAWQRGQLQGEALDAHLAYWKAQLGAGSPALALPTDRPRPPVQSFRGATRWVRLAPDLSRALYDLGRRHDATLFMTLAAGLIALLHRYTGQDDLSLSTPIAGRPHPETESLIGFFVNTLILRVDASGDPTFTELLRRVREVALGAYAHQDLPFEMLVEALKLERDLSRTPLAQVMFVLQNAPAAPLETPGLRLAQMETDTGTAKFDLTLMLEETPDGLRGWWNYNTDLFDAATIERLVAHFENLLAGAAADPAARLSALPVLTEAERARLTAWNGTATGEPAPEPVHHLIAAQAARTPDAVALVAGGASLTYRELDERADELAQRLSACGVGAPGRAETIVGVCLDRSPEAVIALLGIFKAGGAYLPLDPAYPADRLAFMLADSGASIVITTSALAPLLPGASARVLCLDTDGASLTPSAVSRQPSTASPPPPAPDSLAYVIYTSGSTGQPKGVMIEHGALAAHCRDIARHYALTPADRVLQFAALNFDPSLEQVLPTLMAGATVVLRDEALWPPQDFYRRVVELGLTVVNLPPAYWHQVAALTPRPPLPPASGGEAGLKLRLVIVGGDAMPAESLALWRRTPLAGARLLNAYGPTEATITATTFEVAPDFVPAFATLPIGRPLPNRQAFILDPHGRPAPIGVPGELYLAGNLARGYLNRPELTAERFIQVSSGQGTGDNRSALVTTVHSPLTTLYKTGDLARWLPSGDIEFLGRVDQQVKVRGFRVELGEIEAALGQHPAVREAVVIAHDDAGGDKTLVAYVVARASARWLPDELRDFLKARLPAYMVPAAFIPLDALPLTPSGKVDRRALPAADLTRRTARAAYVAPRDPAEAQLAQLWAEVLRVERVGVHDDFFDLGGHSLLATQLAARVRDAFQVDLPLRRLFEATTVAELAVLIAQEQAARLPDGDLDDLLAELDGLSDEDAQRLLAGGAQGPAHD